VYSQRRETDVVDSELGFNSGSKSDSDSVAVLFSYPLVIQITDQPSDSPVMLFLTVFRFIDAPCATVQSVDDRVPLPIG